MHRMRGPSREKPPKAAAVFAPPRQNQAQREDASAGGVSWFRRDRDELKQRRQAARQTVDNS